MKYTVLLLRPDYITDNYGQDTFMTHVDAPTPEEAIEKAIFDVMVEDGADEGELASGRVVSGDDYYVLMCIAGHHDDLS